jgi:hypothetical protein
VVTFNSRGRSGDQHESVTVMTNDPLNESTKLEIKGNVTMVLSIAPRVLDFQRIFEGESKTLTVTLTPQAGIGFDITRVVSPGPEFKVFAGHWADIGFGFMKIVASAKQKIVEKFGSEHRIPQRKQLAETERPDTSDVVARNSRMVSVRLLPTAAVGAHMGTLRIHTNLDKKPLVEVDVIAVVMGDITVQPRLRDLGVVRRGRTIEGSFRIESRDEAPFSITTVETDSEHLSTELSMLESDWAYKLKVSVLPDAPLGMFRASVTLHTTDQDQPELKVRLTANIVK